MGCAASKLEELPAVALCRDRCKYLEEALSQTQALADAHRAYLASLRTLGPVLHRFFDMNIHVSGHGPQPPLPAESETSESESEECCCTSSNSASHIQFPSDSESSESEDKGPHKLSEEKPIRPLSGDEYLMANEGSAFMNSSGGLASKSPPPPPPPTSSTWDFLNLFDAYEGERYLAPLYSLEPEDVTAADKIKPKDDTIGDEKGHSRPMEKHLPTETSLPSVSVKQNKQSKQSKQRKQGVGCPVPAQAEALRELHLLFARASDSGNQVLKLLQSHHHTNSLHQEYGFDGHEGLVMSSQKSLPYTLQTLLLWEKKLYNEVKAEERLRIAYEKKSRMMLKYLEHNKGGNVESPKVESLGTALCNLTTKMKISIQIVDRVSITINKLRDEELWAQIIEFIHRLLGMWEVMVECHKSQYKAFAEGGISNSGMKLKGAHHVETAIELKLELQNWRVCFSNWIVTQKRYVKALNGWLVRCLLLNDPSLQQEAKEEKEKEKEKEVGGAGVPPVFVICNEWCEAVDSVSEKQVIEAIRGFYTGIHLLLTEHLQYHQQLHIVDNDGAETLTLSGTENKDDDVTKKVGNLDVEQRNMLQKMMMMRGGRSGKKNNMNNNVNVSALSMRRAGEEGISVVWDLKQTLMALDKFTANSHEAYKQLHAHSMFFVTDDKSAAAADSL